MASKIDHILRNLNKRKIRGYFVENSKEAVNLALTFVKEGNLVSWGGSVTLEETGLKDRLRQMEKEGRITLIDPHSIKEAEESLRARKKSIMADLYFMSTNALTIDGELVNIDGIGNRVAALAFGANKVIILAGINKLTNNLEEAMIRAKEEACVKNAVRLNKKTPCTLTGKCCDCILPGETICSTIVTTRFSYYENRIHLILINEELGF